MSTTSKEAEGLSYLELKALLEKKKEAEIDKVTKELTAAEGIVASLRAQLVNLGVGTAPVKRRGRKPNAFKMNGAAPKKTRTKKGKRGAVGDSIRAFLAKKGARGAHVKEIAEAIGNKAANVTAFFYAKANKGKFKQPGKATWAVK